MLIWHSACPYSEGESLPAVSGQSQAFSVPESGNRAHAQTSYPTGTSVSTITSETIFLSSAIHPQLLRHHHSCTFETFGVQYKKRNCCVNVLFGWIRIVSFI